MKRWEPIAYPGPENGFGAATHKNFDQGTGGRGSWLDAGGYQQLIDEGCLLVEKSGMALDGAKSDQVTRAVRSGLLNWSAAGGTGNALSIMLDPAPEAWSDLIGMPLNLLLSATNTAAATLAVTGLPGTKPILRPGGAPLVKGDLGAGGILRAMYDGAAIQMAGLTQSSGVTTQIYSTPGTYNWVCPPGVFRVYAQVWGAGGGGGGAAAVAGSASTSAGGGGYNWGYYDVVPGATYVVTVGAGGPGGSATPTGGSTGGTSSFSTFLSATGGTGGGAANGGIQSSTGVGGTSSGGQGVALQGGEGGVAYSLGAGVVILPGGGFSFTSSLAQPIATGVLTNGRAGVFPGGGGGGAYVGGSGGTGANGQVILEY